MWAICAWLIGGVPSGAAEPSVGSAKPAPALAAASTGSTAPASSDLLDRIQAKYATVSVLRGTFVQKSGSALYGEDEQSGTVVLERPGKMRWEFADGRRYVSDGSTMWIYTPADKQVIRIKGFDAQAATADAVLQSLHQLKTLFDVTIVSTDPKAGHELSLLPKTADDAQFKKLVLKLDAALLIDVVQIVDLFDTVTTIDFRSVELGGAVAPDVFTFQVPDGVQVIDAGS
ncbi:MAG: outer membrane lipoprotein carrier protein LolA [Myxococcota bacterium]